MEKELINTYSSETQRKTAIEKIRENRTIRQAENK
jgi:hypothetical protein